jgi:hypothetical protein
MGGVVTAVSRSATHSFSKSNEDRIRLLAGLGGEVRPGDAIGIELPPEPHRSLDRV